jgi:hypothetical protein
MPKCNYTKGCKGKAWIKIREIKPPYQEYFVCKECYDKDLKVISEPN